MNCATDESNRKLKPRIARVEITEEALSGRGGLSLFAKYVEASGILAPLSESFGKLRRSNKGASIESLFKQVLCFLFDGTSRHISHFDQIQKDPGFAGVIEEQPSHLVSSHTVKRFFSAFPLGCHRPFRAILKRLFL